MLSLYVVIAGCFAQSCPAHLNSIGWATLAIWSAIIQYTLSLYLLQLHITSHNFDIQYNNVVIHDTVPYTWQHDA